MMKRYVSVDLQMTQPYIGPYEITAVEDVNVTLRLPKNRTPKVHANRLKPFFGGLAEMDRKLWFACLVSDLFNSPSFGRHCAAI